MVTHAYLPEWSLAKLSSHLNIFRSNPMKTLKTSIVVIAATLSFSAVANPSFVAGDQTAETKMCLAAVTNDLHDYKKYVENFSFEKVTNTRDHRLFANKLECNGQNVVKFARTYGAEKTANFINSYRSQNVSVRQDVANIETPLELESLVVTASLR